MCLNIQKAFYWLVCFVIVITAIAWQTDDKGKKK